METEFINAFIQRQKSFIEEIVNKNLLLEAKLSVTEKVIAELSSKLEQATSQENKKAKPSQ